MRAGRAGRWSAAAAAIACAVGLASALPAHAERVESALGVPCSDQSAFQRCDGSVANRVESWDGVPLDVNLTLPPTEIDAPYPLIAYMHGWGVSKDLRTIDVEGLAERGYAVLTYSSRGFGMSCGAPASRAHPGCERGWVHLADARYEARDTQHLAGLLADEGLAKPRRVGVTGDSQGGGLSFTLATLKNRVMLPGGRLVRWRSPAGRRMRIAAAAPRIGWSDIAQTLVPNGNTLDFRTHNPYRMEPGVAKRSYIDFFYNLGLATGYYAPEGADPDADLTAWKRLADQGEPYDPEDVRFLVRQATRYRSAYYLQRSLPRRKRVRPAPILAYNAWTDDLLPADEALRYRRYLEHHFPRAHFGMVFADGFGHPRASLAADSTAALDAAYELFDRYLMGDTDARPLRGVMTFTQGCNGAAAKGPFVTRQWDAQHPGEVRFRERAPKRFDSEGGSQAIADAVDPISPGTSCRTVSNSSDDPGTATYRLPAPDGEGYTLMGAPTVVARIKVEGDFPQIAARLWDVAPNGSQTLVTRAIYRPDRKGRQVFQLFPNGWHFAAGHVPKLELLGRDAPYARASNGEFTITVRRLALDLPVQERPDGKTIKRYAPPRLCGPKQRRCGR